MGNRGNEFFSRGGICIVLALFFIVPLISGCGYKFRADGDPVGLEIKSLAIPMVTSTSSTLGFEADFTRILREEFISHARVPIKPKEQAQMILRGSILGIRIEPISYNIQESNIQGNIVTHDVTVRRRIWIVSNIYLSDKETGKIIWHEPSMTEETSFTVSDDPLVNRHNQKQALEKIARDLSKKIYLRTMERF